MNGYILFPVHFLLLCISGYFASMSVKSILFIPVLFLLSCNREKQTKKDLSKNTFVYRELTPFEINAYGEAVTRIYEQTIANTGFWGGILVAKNGKIIFERYTGYTNPALKDTITATTPIHLASISKTLTAAAVLKLTEQGKLSLNDTLQRFFPLFPYSGITVQMLLSHRSGLPNYLYFMDTAFSNEAKITNKQVLDFMIERKPALYALPGKNFGYCNTNYVLLALIVEQKTQTTFPKYMCDSIFTPLGMHNSFVFSLADSNKYLPSYNYNLQPFKAEKYDYVYGDKNIFSTPQDLLLWDNALYQSSILNKETLKQAFTPLSNERPSLHNYGLGWRLWSRGNEKIIYHNGWWHGNNTSFIRSIHDTVTLIALGNKYNRGAYMIKELLKPFRNNGVDLQE